MLPLMSLSEGEYTAIGFTELHQTDAASSQQSLHALEPPRYSPGVIKRGPATSISSANACTTTHAKRRGAKEIRAPITIHAAKHARAIRNLEPQLPGRQPPRAAAALKRALVDGRNIRKGTFDGEIDRAWSSMSDGGNEY